MLFLDDQGIDLFDDGMDVVEEPRESLNEQIFDYVMKHKDMLDKDDLVKQAKDKVPFVKE